MRVTLTTRVEKLENSDKSAIDERALINRRIHRMERLIWALILITCSEFSGLSAALKFYIV